MKNPVEIIARTRRRLAWLAAVRTLLHVPLPIAVTLTVALVLNAINALAFDHFGYLIDQSALRLFELSLFGLVAAELIVAAFLAWQSWAHASDFMWAAERIDQSVGAQQEIVTLASLSDPAHTESKSIRSGLFPMLWERVSAYLETFEPTSSFKLDARGPLARSSVFAALALIILSVAIYLLMTVPTPALAVSRRLQLLARSMDKSAAAPAQQQMAAAARDVARDLENPKLPPQEKLAELQALKQELEKYQARQQHAQGGKGNSSGGSSGNGSGGGQGSGQGAGSDKGNGAAATDSGTGQAGKGNQQMVELRNDIAKAQMKLEQEADSGKRNNTAQNDSANGTGAAPKPGDNANQPGGQNQLNGSGASKNPQPSLAGDRMASGQSPNGPRQDKGSMGDTHLGEFPKGGSYERFYKLGEHGPTINIRDARYVTFQLPTEIESAGAGATVPDQARPRATTPYTNAPLKAERLAVSPDEQQLVPPRYRELIH
jgi:hypothetical protein